MKNADLEKIYRTSLNFLRPLSLAETCKTVLDEAAKLIGADYGTVYIRDQNNRLQRVFTNVPQNLGKDNPRPGGFAYKALKTAKPYILDRDYLKKFHPKTAQEVKSMIMVPVYNRGRPFSVITLQFLKKPKHLEKLSDFIRIYSTISALAIRKAQLYQRVTKALEDRDLFISIAGHELRTPLTAISIYNQLISAELKKGKMPDPKWSQEITNQVERFTRLINDFLYLRSIKRGEIIYTMRPCRISELARQTVTAARIRFKRYKVRLKSEAAKNTDIVEGDADKLLQVFNNLIVNATKFSSPEEPILVTVHSDTKHVFFSVKDRGVGIEKKDFKKIFQKYYRSSGERQGMGIGLYLSKNIVDAHKGTIAVDSQKKKGATFTVTLPRMAQH